MKKTEIDWEGLYTRHSLAKALDVSYQAIQHWERGGKVPTPSFPFWRRTYYTLAELKQIVEFVETWRRIKKKTSPAVETGEAV